MNVTTCKLNKREIDFLRSLPDLELEALLRQLPTSDQAVLLAALTSESVRPQDNERRSQRERMAAKRAAVRDLVIPLPANLKRRADCLTDPVLFLQTYFPETFNQPFTKDRQAMLASIIDAAKYGGDHAIAGPRGEGKTRLAMYGALYLMLAGLSPFPVVIGKSQTKAQNELKTIRERLQQSENLIADFPEVGEPFRAVGGWSSRARMQTVAGRPTNIELAADHLIFPTIAHNQLPDDWPSDCEPVSRGQIMSSLGIDGPIRGTNYRDRRPTLAIIDDIEDKQAAESETIIERNEEILEKDVGGLGAGGRRVSRVMLCTTQNRKCIAYKYTDRSQKPSWNGARFRKLVTPPDRQDLWDKYIELRVGRTDEDPDAREAFRFYRDNQDAMDLGCEISNPYSYDQRLASDGQQLELSAIQAYYNRIADFGKEAVATEDDNDPPEQVGPQGSGLTAQMVASRLSGLDRRQLPANTVCLTAGIDLGKYLCHWVVCAWWKGAGGVVVDYGVAEVQGTDVDMTKEASEPMIYRALVAWRDELLASQFIDATGQQRQPAAVFVDSGDFTDAAYEFIRQVGGSPFYATKGQGNYRQPKPSKEVAVGNNLHAHYLAADRVWLYSLNADYWKRWIHERFLTPTFDENNMLRPGALSLFQPTKRKHLSYSQHIVAEEWVSEFKQGKGERCYWMVNNRNNHWLDATAMAAAAATLQGVSVLTNVEGPKLAPTRATAAKAKKKQKARPRHGFRTRPGGWIPRRG